MAVRAAGVNRADLLQAAGHYPGTARSEPDSGYGGIGGDRRGRRGVDVAEWSVGQEVCALLAGGGYAEYVAAPAGQVMPIPDGVDIVTAAGPAGGRVHRLVEPGDDRPPEGRADGADPRWRQRNRHPRDPGRTGAGRPGRGHRRFGGKAGALPRPGRRHHDQLPRRGLRSTGSARRLDGAGADVILDIMGAAYLDRNIDALASDGQVVIIGCKAACRPS